MLLSTHFCVPLLPDELDGDHSNVTDVAITSVTNDCAGRNQLVNLNHNVFVSSSR